MTIKESVLKGVYLVESPIREDERGFLKELIRKNELERSLDFSFNLAQLNHSRSKKNSLRGIHVSPCSKIIYCINGNVQSVIVDLKRNSPTFGKHLSLVIGEENMTVIIIPPYCGNSYLTLSESADYLYLLDESWQPGKEYGIIWNDPSLNINWKIKGEPILSQKDKQNLSLNDYLRKMGFRL
jgi:dTDP-4-dehydrorhamnose 3,5-epimerase